MSHVPSLVNGPAKPLGWFGRNKQLAIALGCVGLLVTAIVLGGALLVTIVLTALRSSDAYQLALGAATRDPVVVAELGPPVQAGWFTMGSVTVTGPSGDASLAIPISGSRGSGTLNVAAHKAGGRWTFSVLNVSIAGRAAPIDLLPPTP